MRNQKEPKDWTVDDVLGWLRASGLSYYRLGQITGMSAVIMSSYVQGKSVPKRETCIQLAEAIQRYERGIENAVDGYNPGERPSHILRDRGVPVSTTDTLAALADRLQYENQRSREELSQLTLRVSDSLRAVLSILKAAKKDPAILELIPDIDLEY